MNSPDTSNRSNSSDSDLEQALLALRDLARSAPPGTDPAFVSALQQARMVLRRHGRTLERVEDVGPTRQNTAFVS